LLLYVTPLITPLPPHNLLLLYQIKEQFPFIEQYHGAWPAMMLIRQFLTNHRGYVRKKAALAAAEAGETTALEQSDQEDDDDSEDDDAVVSGIDDDN